MSFNITILGSNSALPAFGRNHSAQLLQIEDMHILIDCGEGTQLQLARHKSKIQRIEHIFISHLHGDHYLGLMGLIFTMNLNKRKKPLNIYSHYGLEEIITLQLKHSQSFLHFNIIFHPIENGHSGLLLKNERLEVNCFPLKHRIPCSGFLFREKVKPRRIIKDSLPSGIKLQQIVLLKQGKDVYDEANKLLYKFEDYTLPPKKSRSYAYCSDTAYDRLLIKYVKEVDLLYHEATFLKEHTERAEHTFHSTTIQAANLAKEANVGRLMIGHYSARYRELDPFLNEASTIFPETLLAIEGNTVEIPE